MGMAEDVLLEGTGKNPFCLPWGEISSSSVSSHLPVCSVCSHPGTHLFQISLCMPLAGTLEILVNCSPSLRDCFAGIFLWPPSVPLFLILLLLFSQTPLAIPFLSQHKRGCTVLLQCSGHSGCLIQKSVLASAGGGVNFCWPQPYWVCYQKHRAAFGPWICCQNI